MPVEDIVGEIRKQERIINDAQKAKDRLYDELLAAGSKGYELMSVKEAARLLGVGVSTVYSRVNSGSLRAKRIGSSVRVYRDDVLAINDV